MTNIWRDVRFALRNFAKNRGFAAAVIVSIALGIAANTTVFTVVNALLLGEMPVREPDRLVTFSSGRTYSWPDYVDYREQTRSVFEGLSAHFPMVPASVGGKGEPERIWGQLADSAYFTMVGPPLQLGRGFVPAEDNVPRGNPVVILSDTLWKRRFAADPAVVGKTLILNNTTYTVIGVTAPGFRGTNRGFIGEFWAPLAMAPQLMPDLRTEAMKTQRNAQWLILIGRLKPGVTKRQAVAAVNTIQLRLEQEYRKGQPPRKPMTLDKVGSLPKGTEIAIGGAAVMMVVVGTLLLIACVNVASLLLARATTRRKEIAIRLAIGAGRWRIVRQLLTESILLSLMGAVVGFLVAIAATRAMSGFELPVPLPIGLEFAIDTRVVLFTAGIALAAGVIFGLAPALRATRHDLTGGLKNESAPLGGIRRLRARNALVLVQVALSLVLLVGAGLFVRSLNNAVAIDIGMRTDGVLMMAVDPKLHHYSPAQTRQFVSELRRRVSSLPGVASVSFVDSIPLSIAGTTLGFTTQQPGQPARSVEADVYTVGEGYFSTMGIPLRRGRDFDLRRDTTGSLILNEEAARQLFPDRDPLGLKVETEQGPGAGKRLCEVIGVVRNSKTRTLGEGTSAGAYLFLEPQPEQVMSFYGITTVVRGTMPPGALATAVREQIHALDANLPVFNVETMNEHVNKSMLLPRLCATLLGIFGAGGAILAMVGLYGVISFAARARTREIGIRMALGAQPATVLQMILREGMLLVGAGLAIGMGLSFAATRFTRSLLYGISTTDPVTFTIVPVAMLLVAAVAVWVPARRAARIAPLEALHHD